MPYYQKLYNKFCILTQGIYFLSKYVPIYITDYNKLNSCLKPYNSSSLQVNISLYSTQGIKYTIFIKRTHYKIVS